jgi:hypothetical protein
VIRDNSHWANEGVDEEKYAESMKVGVRHFMLFSNLFHSEAISQISLPIKVAHKISTRARTADA